MKKSQINFYYSGPHSKSSGLNMSKKEDFILGGDDINTDVYLDCWYQSKDMVTSKCDIEPTRKFFDIKVMNFVWEGQPCIIVVMDNVSQKIQNERLKNFNFRKNELLKAINHNLKTPLNGILGISGIFIIIYFIL